MSRRQGLVVALCAFLSSARAGVAWTFFDGRLIPDTSAYAAGGLGLYPSPIGRAIGALGEWPLAIANALAAGALVYVTALVAVQLGGSPVVASLVALLTPLALWSMFAGMDSLGGVFLLLAVHAWLRERRRLTGLWALLGALTHLATFPLVAAGAIVLGGSWRRRLVALGGVGAGSLLGLFLTPYGGVVYNALDPLHAAKVAILTVGTASVPFLPFLGRLIVLPAQTWRVLAVFLVGTAGAAGLQSGDRTTNARYALPLTMLLAAVVAVPRRRREPKVTRGAFVPALHTEANCFCGCVADVHPWVNKSTGWQRGRCTVHKCLGYRARAAA